MEAVLPRIKINQLTTAADGAERCREAASFNVGMSSDTLDQRTIGAAIAVHKSLGPGFTEPIYMKAIDLDSGLLLNFGTMPLAIRKVFPSRFPS